MDIPIELFLGFIGVSITLAIFGFLRNPQIPATIVMGGMFLLVIAVATDNIIMNNQLIESTISEQTTSNTTSYVYNVQSFTTTINNANFTGMNYGQTENPTATSVIIGEQVQCINIPLQRTGSPNGNILIGMFSSPGSMPTVSFATVTANSISTNMTNYEYCLPETSEVIVTSGQRFGFTVTGGNSTNYITTIYSNMNPFDGSNTLRTFLPFGTTTWSNSGTASHDMTMQLYDLIPNIETIQENQFDNNLYEFTELPKTLFALIGVMIMLIGGLMVMKE